MAEVSDLSDHDAFDAFARSHGWRYDNGWTYGDKHWDSYYAPDSFRGLQALRQSSGLVVVIDLRQTDHSEIWSGKVGDSHGFLQMIAALTEIVGADPM